MHGERGVWLLADVLRGSPIKVSRMSTCRCECRMCGPYPWPCPATQCPRYGPSAVLANRIPAKIPQGAVTSPPAMPMPMQAKKSAKYLRCARELPKPRNGAKVVAPFLVNCKISPAEISSFPSPHLPLVSSPHTPLIHPWGGISTNHCDRNFPMTTFRSHSGPFVDAKGVDSTESGFDCKSICRRPRFL
jgi:hypothetical protein